MSDADSEHNFSEVRISHWMDVADTPQLRSMLAAYIADRGASAPIFADWLREQGVPEPSASYWERRVWDGAVHWAIAWRYELVRRERRLRA